MEENEDNNIDFSTKMLRPLPLIALDEHTGIFEMGEDAAEIISRIDKPLAVRCFSRAPSSLFTLPQIFKTHFSTLLLLFFFFSFFFLSKQIIAIAGMYRTGKSFIMNQLAGRVNGFTVGATIGLRPCRNKFKKSKKKT